MTTWQSICMNNGSTEEIITITNIVVITVWGVWSTWAASSALLDCRSVQVPWPEGIVYRKVYCKVLCAILCVRKSGREKNLGNQRTHNSRSVTDLSQICHRIWKKNSLTLICVWEGIKNYCSVEYLRRNSTFFCVFWNTKQPPTTPTMVSRLPLLWHGING